MSFLARSRYGPFIYVGLGVALIVFALVVTSASRLVFVVAGIAILAGLANGIARLSRTRRNSSTGAPER
jgi:heme exporter protein D